MAPASSIETATGEMSRPPGRPIHVLHLIETLGPGGAERLLYTNLKNLDREDFRHTVVTVFGREPHWLEPIQGLGIEVIDLGCGYYWDLVKGTRRLSSVLRRVRPNLIHTHLWAADIIGRIAGRFAGVPVVSSVHNMEYDPEARSDEGRRLALKREAALLLDRWTARTCANRLVAVSEYVGRSASRLLRFPPERIDLVYNPVDFEELASATEIDDRGVWDELGLPPGSLVLLNVGRVVPQKGLLYAIRALREIVVSFPATHLVSVGSLVDRAYLKDLRSEAEKLGVSAQFHTLGPRRDVPRLLQACDLFVFPSLYEGMGIALIEAMAMGCACVASDVGPLPELMRHGRDGLLVTPRSSEQLTEAVCSLLADPVKRASLAGSAAISPLDRFQPTDSAARLAAVYKSVLDHGR